MIFRWTLMIIMSCGLMGDMRTQGQDLSVPEVYFIQDYVDFYNIKHICIVQEGV